uniref:MTOR-associated protein MEAK7 n=1 Tax=Pristionchus pacificus TaxID=54126 RepID=A0A8R1UPB3_PRIPA
MLNTLKPAKVSILIFSQTMGAAESAVAEKFCNLNADQLEAVRGNIKKVTVQDGLSEHDFQKLLPHWGSFASVAFANLGRKKGLKKDRLPVSTFVAQVNLLEGIASDQAEALTNLFDAKWQEAIVACVCSLLQLPSAESAALLAFLQKDKSSNLTNMITSNRLLGELVHLPFKHLLSSKKSIMPKLSGNTTLLTPVAQLAIRSHIPVEFRDKWQLLFSSNQHGSSFSQMAQRVDGQGPCLLIIRSTKGHVFGLFASHGFVSGPTYTGDSLSFLFSLSPSIGIHEATGFCKKYCYLNQQQETLPNGMGIGGSSDDNWPLFLSEDYGSGIACANSSAFEKCDLAGEKHFEIHTLEVWRVGPPPAVKQTEKSILDKDPQAQALLELAGKKMHSTAYRDPAPLLSDGEDD